MYLFVRRARLAGGNGRAGIEWATEMCERVHQVADVEVGLWATVYSEGFGTISWTAWMPDLAALETAGDKLMVDGGYQDAADRGASLTVGGLDDALFEVVHGTPDPAANPQYVTSVRAVCAAGQFAGGMTVGIGIAERATAATGLPTMFVRALTGPYGGVGWLTGFPDVTAIETAQRALATDADWLAYLDGPASGAFVEDAAITQSTLHRRIA
jgi:hypothetical protein